MMPFLAAALSSPFARWLAGGAAVVVVLAWVYGMGQNAAQDRCDADALRARIAAMERDMAQAIAAEEDARRRADTLTKKDAERNAIIDTLQRERETLANGVCRLSPDDLGRLRRIN